MDNIELPVELHDSVKFNVLFNCLKKLKLAKPIIFEYGILNIEIPKNKIGENEYEYREGKLPSFACLYEDHILIDKERGIINDAQGDMLRDVSEIIGVGIGLYYSVLLLGIEKNKIKKIARPKQQGKYCDFCFSKAQRLYECETKGTTGEGTVDTMIIDVKKKKSNKTDIACRFGVITLAGKSDNNVHSKITVCDDFDDIQSSENNDIYHYLDYYKFILIPFIKSNCA